MLHMCEGKQAVFLNKFKFVTAVNLNKCLQQIKFPLYASQLNSG